MTDEAIKAALREAEDAALRAAWKNRGYTDDPDVEAMRAAYRQAGAWADAIHGARAAIEAFLRALPEHYIVPTEEGGLVAINAHKIAAAVSRAAQEDGR